MKKLVLFLVLSSMLLGLTVNAGAAVLGDVGAMQKEGWPWDACEAIEAAAANGDDAEVVRNGEIILAKFLGTADPQVKADGYLAGGDTAQINVLWMTLDKLSKSYERLGDIPNTVRILKAALPFARAYKAAIAADPADMDFAIENLTNRLSAYDVVIDVYAQIPGADGDVSYTGAKFEPKTGMYYGEVDGKSSGASKKSSGAIIYVEYEIEDIRERIEYSEQTFRTVSNHSVIEVAWNLMYEGATLKSIPNDGAKITEAAKYLASLDVNILLRFGAEMDNWASPEADPEEFKTAFKYVAGIIKQYAPNVAMVWSVTTAPRAGTTYEDFYPGDEYVDWVGVSLYTAKYFLGNVNTTDETHAIYGTGKYANPLTWISKLVALYGSRKPIIVSEGGVQNYNASNNEQLTNWAMPKMRIMYEYIPIVYPQVKAMFYFNTEVGEQRYALYRSTAVNDLYNEMTKSGYYLENGKTESGVTYKKLGGASVPAKSVSLTTYAPYFTTDNVSVTYELSGTAVRTLTDIPYRTEFDLSGYADGDYALTVTVRGDGNALAGKSYTVRKSGNTASIYEPGAAPVIEPAPSGVTALPTAAKVLIDGVETAFEAYNIGGSNYFKLRDIACALINRFNIGYADGKITLTPNAQYTAVGGEMSPGDGLPKDAAPSYDTVYLGGEALALGAYKIGGNNYYKLRDIGKALDFNVTWNGTNILISTNEPYSDN